MASEGAVMGIPGVYLDPVGRGYTDEQEHKYNIVFNFTPEKQGDAIAKAVDILKNYREEEWRIIGKRIVEEKVDVTEMMYEVALKGNLSI
jgi:predicted glycosyltransferase